MKNIIELELLALDFKGALFESNLICAISKACRRQLSVERVSEGCDIVGLDGLKYTHRFYGYGDFLRDSTKAEKHNFDNTVIRTLTLTEV